MLNTNLIASKNKKHFTVCVTQVAYILNLSEVNTAKREHKYDLYTDKKACNVTRSTKLLELGF